MWRWQFFWSARGKLRSMKTSGFRSQVLNLHLDRVKWDSEWVKCGLQTLFWLQHFVLRQDPLAKRRFWHVQEGCFQIESARKQRKHVVKKIHATIEPPSDILEHEHEPFFETLSQWTPSAANTSWRSSVLFKSSKCMLSQWPPVLEVLAPDVQDYPSAYHHPSRVLLLHAYLPAYLKDRHYATSNCATWAEAAEKYRTFSPGAGPARIDLKLSAGSCALC